MKIDCEKIIPVETPVLKVTLELTTEEVKNLKNAMKVTRDTSCHVGTRELCGDILAALHAQ